MKKIYSFLTVAALLLAGFTSCAVDQDGTTPQNTTPGHGTKVTIKINNGAAAKTRATAGTASTLTGADRENQITNLYAVLYKDKNSSYAYYKTFACTQDATNTDEYTFDVEDEAAGGVYYMYLIANPTTELKTVFDNDNAGASANSIDTEADLYAFTVTPVLGPTADDTDNTKNNINKVTDFVMTSPRVQLDMAGDEETVVGGTDGITLTRLAARFDIDATALNITNADPSKETTFQITKVTMNKRYTESDLIRGGIRGISMAHPTTASTDLASSANVEFDKFLTEANYIDADGKYWYGAIYSCENYDTSNPTILTIEGVYKHGENQTLNVSQEVEFRNIVRDGSGNITSQDVIQIQRNHLYKVILTPKYNNGALEFGKIDYAIQVNDWQTGETLVFAGDANLTAQSQPSFTVTNALSVKGGTGTNGTTNPTLIYTGIDNHSVYLTVTSQTTGTMLECSTFPSTQYGLVSSATTNDADGNLVETYMIDIDDNISNATEYVFKISNAINTSLYREFTLLKRPKLPLEYFATGNVKKDGNNYSILPATTATATNNVTQFEWLNNSNPSSAMTLFYNNSNVDSERGVMIDGKRWRLPTPWEQMAFGPAYSNRSLIPNTYAPNTSTGDMNENGNNVPAGGLSGGLSSSSMSVGTQTKLNENIVIDRNLYKIQSTYYRASTNVWYGMRFEERTDGSGNIDNLYRCLYRFTWNTTNRLWIIDAHYIGDSTPPAITSAASEPWNSEGYITVSQTLVFGRYWSNQRLNSNMIWDMRADDNSFRVFTDSGSGNSPTGAYFFVRLIINE